jgi:transposase-like protein
MEPSRLRVLPPQTALPLPDRPRQKEGAVQRLEFGASVTMVARACEAKPNVLDRWHRRRREGGAKAFPGEGHRRTEESRIAEFEHKVGGQPPEIDFLRSCLQSDLAIASSCMAPRRVIALTSPCAYAGS